MNILALQNKRWITGSACEKLRAILGVKKPTVYMNTTLIKTIIF